MLRKKILMGASKGVVDENIAREKLKG